MIKNNNKIKHILLGAALTLSLIGINKSSYADSCDSCTTLTNIENYTAQTADNTSFLASIANAMQSLLQTTTLAFFGQLPDLGNTMAEFTTIPAVQDQAYQDQTDLLTAIEKTYSGNSDEDGTLQDNYKAIFDDYLMNDDNTNNNFNIMNTSAASLFLNPSSAGYYSDAQKLAAETYIQLLSGAALSTQRTPSSSWLPHDSYKDKQLTRKVVTEYYTFNAMQSAIADSLAFVYSMNTGHNINGSLDNYNGSIISESGLLKYIQSNKVENEDWYTQLGSMSVGAVLKEQTILIAGAFLELMRIEEVLKRQLVVQATSASSTLSMTQTLSNMLTKTNQS